MTRQRLIKSRFVSYWLKALNVSCVFGTKVFVLRVKALDPPKSLSELVFQSKHIMPGWDLSARMTSAVYAGGQIPSDPCVTWSVPAVARCWFGMSSALLLRPCGNSWRLVGCRLRKRRKRRSCEISLRCFNVSYLLANLQPSSFKSFLWIEMK